MIKKVVFKIKGMSCTSCAMMIDGDLEDSGKVKSCRTSYVKSQTEVEFDPERMGEEEIVKLIGKAGFKVAEYENV